MHQTGHSDWFPSQVRISSIAIHSQNLADPQHTYTQQPRHCGFLISFLEPISPTLEKYRHRAAWYTKKHVEDLERENTVGVESRCVAALAVYCDWTVILTVKHYLVVELNFCRYKINEIYWRYLVVHLLTLQMDG
jgi:hypothetical protein